VIDRFGNPESFVPEGSTFSESPELGMAHGEPFQTVLS
jgi:hypothetical protein